MSCGAKKRPPLFPWAAVGTAVSLVAGGGAGCVLDFPEEWLYQNCGDGVIDPSEDCDDGDSFSDNGCSATCRVENGYHCTGEPSDCVTECGDGIRAGTETCDDGNTVSGDGCSALCRVEAGDCGDGNIDANEGCDDGGAGAGDGCSATCQVEEGWSCTGTPSTCEPICGDGIRVVGEACDDNNRQNGDGCGALCTVEPGWYCTGAPSDCVTNCGDGIPAGEEGCDDLVGTPVGGDGCSATCTVERGYACTGTPSVCTIVCGDGIVLASTETCDDSNIAPNDGCGATCQTETGWDCTGEPSVCEPVCGDGILVAGHEGCEDGDSPPAGGDGCDANCQIEDYYECTGLPSVCLPFCRNGNQDALLDPLTCPIGQKCTLVSNNIQCGPAGTKGDYETCAFDNECEQGTYCGDPGSGSSCLPFCNSLTSLGCPSGSSCALVYGDDQPYEAGLCQPECDPTETVSTVCTGGEACYFGGSGPFCHAPGSIAVGATCGSFAYECVPGASCVNTGTPTCYEVCTYPGGTCDVLGTCHTLNDPIYPTIGICY